MLLIHPAVVVVQNIDIDHWISQEILKSPRDYDLRELKVVHPELEFSWAIEASFQMSVETWGFLGEVGQVLGVGGVAENRSIWFIGSCHLNQLRYQIRMLKVGKLIVEKAVKDYGDVWNLCSTDEGQLWAMQKLGFEVRDTGRENVRLIQCVS